MNNPYFSSDPTVVSFIMAQNSSTSSRGTSGTFAPALENNGIAGTTTDNVVGFSSLAAGQPAISMGSGFNTIIVDGAHSIDPAPAGSPDNFYVSVSPSGGMTLTDANTAQSVSISGASFLIFNGAATSSTGGYQSMYFVGGATQTEITEIYNAAFGRQPDLAGVEYYMNQLNAGVTLQQVAGEFNTSPEFQARYGADVSDSQFITNLYRNVLNRVPASTDIPWYLTNVVDPILNGTTPGTAAYTTADQIAHATLLQDFTMSAENQADVSGFVINTSNAVLNGFAYADPAPGSETLSQALAAAASTNVFDANLVDNSTVPAGGFSSFGSIHPISSVFSIKGYYLLVAGNVGTITLSSEISGVAGTGGPSLTVNTAPGGGNFVNTSLGCTVNLYGTGNIVEANTSSGTQTTNTMLVNYFVKGDYIQLDSTSYGGATFTILQPSASAPISGASLNFPQYANINTPNYIVNVGNVGGGTAAEVAAAANKVYTPVDVGTEAIVFFGQTNNGNTVIYDWYGHVNSTGADFNGNHLVDASEFAGGVTLVGVSSAQITSSSFLHS